MDPKPGQKHKKCSITNVAAESLLLLSMFVSFCCRQHAHNQPLICRKHHGLGKLDKISESIRRTKRGWEKEKEREWQAKWHEEWSNSSLGHSAFLPYSSQPWQTDSRARNKADTHKRTQKTHRKTLVFLRSDHFTGQATISYPIP